VMVENVVAVVELGWRVDAASGLLLFTSTSELVLVEVSSAVVLVGPFVKAGVEVEVEVANAELELELCVTVTTVDEDSLLGSNVEAFDGLPGLPGMFTDDDSLLLKTTDEVADGGATTEGRDGCVGSDVDVDS
jgi:hypothetical protein